ncbi:unnamed protein product [Caenorhabditis auriculariae]|uniref:Uncharacterized protein n=1 Tax=Caenorhabditis auriculariae TaxID=2777116 RepID=A0A8S1GV21_9PELO|nr:unnamed protein product [Caenorhabditis auriculariae]
MLRYLVLLLISQLVQGDFQCPPGFTAITSKCIQVITVNSPHSAAVSKCSDLGGKLVSIHNAIDNNGVINAANGVTNPLWIGLKCAASQASSCFWDDNTGSAGTYNNFVKGWPMTDIGSCVYMSVTGKNAGQWLSGDCDAMILSYVCETNPIDPGNTGCGDYQFGDKCYFPYAYELDETDSRVVCQQTCADLVSIHSMDENKYINTLFGANSPAYIRIGAANVGGNTYVWFDGTPFDFSNIGLSNAQLGSCMSMSMQNDLVKQGQWISSHCETTLPFVCSRRKSVICTATTPVPTQTPLQCTSPFIYEGNGTFFSPGYPNTYEGQANTCNYILYVPSMATVAVNFPIFNLDATSRVDLYNQIEDTKPFITLYGTVNPKLWFNSTTNTMRMVFRTSGDQAGQIFRWQAKFQPSYPGGFTGLPPVTVTPDPYNPSGCNATALYAPGTITSQNYPNLYPNYSECRYLLSTAGGYRVHLNFQNVDTEQCCDIIVVRDGPNLSSRELGRVSGHYPPNAQQFTSTSNQMLVTFSSDSAGQATGFSANFEAV